MTLFQKKLIATIGWTKAMTKAAKRIIFYMYMTNCIAHFYLLHFSTSKYP